eukprot:COSAG05_NODE_229_length_13378_cov_4.728594_5_plen_150_part_00
MRAPKRRIGRRIFGDDNWIWQQDGATAHWTQESFDELALYDKTIANGNILVGVDENGASIGGPGKSGWPSHSPDLNMMDEFIWGMMVSEMLYVDATTKDGLKRALKAAWRKITPEICRNCYRHYYELGGTLDRCIVAEGKRFSRGKLSG